MKTIPIPASRPYPVYVGHGLLQELGAMVRDVCSSRIAAIVSDDTVWNLYGNRAARSLEEAGLEVVSYVFPHGEASKNILEYARLLNFLAENRLTRTDVLVALGGGVVGDLTGFAAATYLRGVRFVQVPTTLLAAVDSSVGGKTAIDLAVGKNLAGAFYQPDLVVCDLDTLSTLPDEIFSDGCAEVVKYAVLGNPPLYALLQGEVSGDGLEDMVCLCIAQKRDVVAADEFEQGGRKFLNLGHTFGHAVEACSRFTLSHGKSVAVGMMMAARGAEEKGLCEHGTAEALAALLIRCGLPTECPYPADMLLGAMLADKKIDGQVLNLILPETIGRCRIYPVPVREAGDWLRAGGAL